MLQIDLQYPGTPEHGSWYNSAIVTPNERCCEELLSPSLPSVSRSLWKSRTQAKRPKEKTLTWNLLAIQLRHPWPPPWEGGSCPRTLPQNVVSQFNINPCQDWSMHCKVVCVETAGRSRVLNKNHWSRPLCANCAWERYSRDGLQRLQGKFATGHLWHVNGRSLIFLDVKAVGWKQIYLRVIMKTLATKWKSDLRGTSEQLELWGFQMHTAPSPQIARCKRSVQLARNPACSWLWKLSCLRFSK